MNKDEFHDGLDIAVPMKTEVKAVKDGQVTETGKSETYGTYIKYKTNDGYTIMYAHLAKNRAKKGNKIKAGEVIALSGNSGLSTGPHLHYSLWYNDKMIDPMDFVCLPYTEEVKNEYSQRGEKLN